MEMTLKHFELMKAAKGMYGGHIKRCYKLKSLTEGFRNSAMGLIFWFNDSRGSTHIVSRKNLCPECGMYKCNCNNPNN